VGGELKLNIDGTVFPFLTPQRKAHSWSPEGEDTINKRIGDVVLVRDNFSPRRSNYFLCRLTCRVPWSFS
jgi:hypothetical protein